MTPNYTRTMRKRRESYFPLMATNSFANHFAQICGDCTNSNHVSAKLKQDVSIEVIWQGDPIKCMKSARTRDCRICMVERKQIMQPLRDDKHNIINENDNIYAASVCKCSSGFHKLANIHSFALRTLLERKQAWCATCLLSVVAHVYYQL